MRVSTIFLLVVASTARAAHASNSCVWPQQLKDGVCRAAESNKKANDDDASRGLIDKTRDLINGAIHGIADETKTDYGKTKDAASSAYDQTKDAAAAAYEQTMNAASSAYATTKEVLTGPKDTVDKTSSTAKDKINDAADSSKSNVEKMKDMATDKFNSIKEAITK